VDFWIASLRGGGIAGPAWFLALLLVFTIAAAFALWSARARIATLDLRPPRFIGFFCALAILAYVPMSCIFGPMTWRPIGPLMIQPSRILLYAVFFGAGALLGAAERDGPWRGAGRDRARGDGVWLIDTAARRGLLVTAAAALATMLALRWARAAALVDWPLLAWRITTGTASALFNATATLGAIALALRLLGRRVPMLASLSRNSYGIYLLHWPFIAWLQFALAGVALAPPAKIALVFALGLPLSWLASAGLRRLPGVSRLL
jgi:peptidoglycan/LPS O-acetylase OafA/YrhL